MKWSKPYGLAAYSSVSVDLEESIIINNGFWYDDNQPEFVNEELDTLRIDPGGMLHTKHPWSTFEVEGYKFELQRYKIPRILANLKSATEFHPGTKTFFVFTYQAVTMTNRLFDLFCSKIKEMEKEDATFNESMDVAIAEGELNEHPNISLNIKREMPDEVH